MKRTGIEIEILVKQALESELLRVCDGVYLSGTRPFDSNSKDAIITFLTGRANQIQKGFVNVNLYTSDIDNGSAVLVKDVAQCLEYEKVLRDIAEFRNEDIIFYPDMTIQTFAEPEIKQHYVNLKLKFKLLTD